MKRPSANADVKNSNNNNNNNNEKRRISTSTLLGNRKKKLWNMKVTIIPIVICAFRTVTK